MRDFDKDAIQSYITKCFQDAFRSESRKMVEGDYIYPFIIIYNTKIDEAILCPVGDYCKYDRVGRRVFSRLKSNLFKNFGVHFSMSNDFATDVYSISKGNTIDPNYTIAKVRLTKRNGKSSESWISWISRDIDTGLDKTKPIPAIRLYKLTMKNYDFKSDEELEEFLDAHPYTHLPDEIYQDWSAFRKLNLETFGNEIDNDFKFYCSDDIEILYN